MAKAKHYHDSWNSCESAFLSNKAKAELLERAMYWMAFEEPMLVDAEGPCTIKVFNAAKGHVVGGFVVLSQKYPAGCGKFVGGKVKVYPLDHFLNQFMTVVSDWSAEASGVDVVRLFERVEAHFTGDE